MVNKKVMEINTLAIIDITNRKNRKKERKY